MIQNEHQYRITHAKLKDLEQDLEALEVPAFSLHTRKILARKNSLNILIRELEQEIFEYDQLKSGQFCC
jgi:hypothetical protein